MIPVLSISLLGGCDISSTNTCGNRASKHRRYGFYLFEIESKEPTNSMFVGKLCNKPPRVWLVHDPVLDEHIALAGFYSGLLLWKVYPNSIVHIHRKPLTRSKHLGQHLWDVPPFLGISYCLSVLRR